MVPNYYLRITANFEELICESCGQVRRPGDWPWCPHASGSYGHTPFDPYIDPHILPFSDPRAREIGYNARLGRHIQGTRITSREQRKQLMKENNVEWAPRPQGQGAEF